MMQKEIFKVNLREIKKIICPIRDKRMELKENRLKKEKRLKKNIQNP